VHHWCKRYEKVKRKKKSEILGRMREDGRKMWSKKGEL
jgi:hypothetical protein